MKRLLIVISFFLCARLFAQPSLPVHWSFSSVAVSDDEFDVMMKATIDEGYHLYSQHLADGGPVPTSFTFEKNSNVKLEGEVKEKGVPKEANEPLFDNMRLIWFEGKVTFVQRVKLLQQQTKLTGTINFMTCNDQMCFPPSDQAFEFVLKKKEAVLDTAKTDSAKGSIAVPGDTLAKGNDSSSSRTLSGVNSNSGSQLINTEDESDVRNKDYWGTFWTGFLSGLGALFFPCVWPIIPLTVSFFLKQNEQKRKRKGAMMALAYSLSIVVIFLLIGVVLSAFTNGQMANELSTGWFFNMLFFVIFFLLGLSFLGVFEIALPHGMVNKVDSMSSKGGILGIFFMAFALVLITFSCTVLFISNLISIVTRDGDFIKPIVGFTGFGLAFGLPFGLLAWFPTALKQLPKSGHWMHVLKVTFGLLEIALSMIYLSKVDMAYHWGILSRDIFLAIWVIIFFVLGLYLMGKLKLSPADDDSYVSVPRLLTAIICLAFALYMFPGLWGSPLKPLSGFLPNYSEFSFFSDGQSGQADNNSQNNSLTDTSKVKKYATLFEAPLGLNLHFDLDEALAVSKQEKKPVFVDFTGWGCVNCRKMEKSVWPNPDVLKKLKEDYVTVSLYVDDKTPLPESERYFSSALNKKVSTLGDRNFDIQYSRFNMGAQPYYVLLDSNGNLLNKPRGYTADIPTYVSFLEEGIQEFIKRN